MTVASECTTLPDHLDRAAARFAHEAVVFPAERVTFPELAARATDAARALRGLGVGPGDRVGILLANGIDYLAVLYGAARLGAIPVPVNARFKHRELRHVVADAGLRTLVVSGDDDHPALLAEAFGDLPASAPDDLRLAGAPQLRQVVVRADVPPPGLLAWSAFRAGARAVDPDEVARLQERVRIRDTAMLLYTSGTTAAPKGCLLSHEALVRTGHAMARTRFMLTPADRMWDPLPLFHLSTLLPLNACLSAGATYVGTVRFDAGEALEQLEGERCTVAFAAFDLIWRSVLDHPRFATADLRAVRLINVNGIPERLREMQARVPWAIQISPYGGTEGGGVIAFNHPDDTLEQRTTTAGRPFAGVEVRIVDPETGAEVPRGERGEITYRGWLLFDGYHGDPEATARAVDADGWFHSGDLGVLHPDGRLSFLGRLKDMLKVGGENVAAAEIEGFLGEHPAVAAVQVVAAPDARLGEVACAFVQLAPGASAGEQELVEHCLGRIATFKVPRYVRFVSDWPMSGTKIQKFVLRERIARELAEAGITEAPVLRAGRRGAYRASA